MALKPTDRVVTVGGKIPLRYAYDDARGQQVAVWYHDGMEKYSEPTWEMCPVAMNKLDADVDTLLVPNGRTVYAIDRWELAKQHLAIPEKHGDGTVHVYQAQRSDDFVQVAGSVDDVLPEDLV